MCNQKAWLTKQNAIENIYGNERDCSMIYQSNLSATIFMVVGKETQLMAPQGYQPIENFMKLNRVLLDFNITSSRLCLISNRHGSIKGVYSRLIVGGQHINRSLCMVFSLDTLHEQVH